MPLITVNSILKHCNLLPPQNILVNHLHPCIRNNLETASSGPRHDRSLPVVTYLHQRIALFWAIVPQVVVFRTDASAPLCCPVTSVKNYNYSLRNSPEERNSLILSGGSLK
jgi:hypothetical protein